MSDPIAAGLIDRFKRVIMPVPARVTVRTPPAPPQPTEEDILQALLHKWATDTPEAFDTHLASVIKRVHGYANGARSQHAETTYWLGYEQALHDLLAAFTTWKASQPIAGNSTFESSPQGGPNAG